MAETVNQLPDAAVAEPVLRVRDLRVRFRTPGRFLNALESVASRCI